MVKVAGIRRRINLTVRTLSSLILVMSAAVFAVAYIGVSSVSTASGSSAPGLLTNSGPIIHPAQAQAEDGLFPFTTVTGKVYMSEDGIGTNDPAGGPVYVQKNDASATVQAAYLLAAGVPGYTMQNGDVTLDGNSLSFPPANDVVGNFGANSVWTDVTSIVKPVVDSAPVGNVAFTAAEPNNTEEIDGEILAVVMNDPTLPTDNTVSFLFGALDTTGDNFAIGLANPLNLSDPNLGLIMSLGDSYSYQGDGQYSTVSVDGTLMSSSAGGNDDSTCKYDSPQDFSNCGNGELITVGGIGDSTDNPPDPTATDLTCGPPGPPRCDDELYNLLPFVHNGDTSITVNTTNPSNDDNIFFSGFQLNSAAAVVGEGAVLSPVSGTSATGTPYTFTCKVQDNGGNPIVGQSVNFSVVSGPDSGQTGTATTDANGDATFALTGSSAGTDTVQCSFTDSSSNSHTSNDATVTWTTTTTTTPTTLKVNPGTGDFADSTSVSAVLTNTNTSAPIAGKLVTLTLNGTESCMGTTDVTGTATCSITPGEAAGPYTLAGSFSGDSTDAAATGNATFTVTHEETALSYTGATSVLNGDNLAVSGVLTTDDPAANTPLPNEMVTFTLGSGATAQSCSATTDSTGKASCSISGVNQTVGSVSIGDSFAGDAFYQAASNSASVSVFAPTAVGAFVVGDLSATTGSNVNFWGSQWAKNNKFSGGSAPSSMKGFANSPMSFTCGSTWKTTTGASSAPPAKIPGMIEVIVSKKVTQNGSVISGTIDHIVMVQVTGTGYGPGAGQLGNGKVVGTVC